MKTVRISYSAIAAYWRCPAYFKQHYLQGKVLPQSGEKQHLSFGTAVHKVLELYHGGLDIHAALDQVMPDVAEGNDRYSGYHLINLMNAYSKYWNDKDVKLMSTEQQLEAEIFNDGNLRVIYQGTADAIMNENGEAVLWEHKTAADIGQQFQIMAEMSNQACGYALLCRMNGINVKSVRYNALQTYLSKLLTHIDLSSRDPLTLTEKQQKLLVDGVPFRRVLCDRNDDDIERFTRDVLICVDDILRDIKTNYFVQKRHEPCTAFGGCEYRNVCLFPKVNSDSEFVIEPQARFQITEE